ncbi:unnamed protein product [Medioppia subpectinata]|uniref:Uncharacterized protein n=1 Tax=Medioppia subpectinata TaxID=1979941 RepID=A0A7R9QE14_9ACAR|nr:unnamed protein product [Medioppia subpectinata]CAG2118398.1 unnamed protein product [Medioppia subpectinata]
MADTDYYVQDITQEWNQWDKSLQKLAGKVSLICSNCTFHWVQESDTAAQNMAKLLSNNNIIIMNILFFGDIYRSAGADTRAELKRRFRYPSEEQLIGQWVTAFRSAGLTRIDIKYRESHKILPVKMYNESNKLFVKWFKRYLTDSTGDEDMDQVIRELLYKERVRAVSEKSPNGEDQVKVNIQVWNFVVNK